MVVAMTFNEIIATPEFKKFNRRAFWWGVFHLCASDEERIEYAMDAAARLFEELGILGEEEG